MACIGIYLVDWTVFGVLVAGHTIGIVICTKDLPQLLAVLLGVFVIAQPEVNKYIPVKFQRPSSEVVALFEALLPRLTRSMDAAQYEELSQKLDMSSGTVKVALHRLRQKFGNSLREVVSETVEDPQEVDLELTELLQVLRDNVEE